MAGIGAEPALDQLALGRRRPPGWSAGESRNHRYQATAQTNPSDPNSANNDRQLKYDEQRRHQQRRQPAGQVHAHEKMPCAVPRSCRGNQRENVRAALGSAPASPAPNRNRIASSDE